MEHRGVVEGARPSFALVRRRVHSLGSSDPKQGAVGTFPVRGHGSPNRPTSLLSTRRRLLAGPSRIIHEARSTGFQPVKSGTQARCRGYGAFGGRTRSNGRTATGAGTWRTPAGRTASARKERAWGNSRRSTRTSVAGGSTGRASDSSRHSGRTRAADRSEGKAWGDSRPDTSTVDSRSRRRPCRPARRTRPSRRESRRPHRRRGRREARARRLLLPARRPTARSPRG